MTELSGTLAGLGLPAIVRFLSGLKKTGCLRLAQDNWRGEVFFEDGQVWGASFGTRRGLSALDGLLQGLPAASFTFESDVRGTVESRIAVSQEVLEAHLDELATHPSPKLPPLDAFPRVVALDDARLADEPVPLDRGMLQTLLLADGRRTVREILMQRDSIEALWQLGQLVEAGLLEVHTERSQEPNGVPQRADLAGADIADAEDALAAPELTVPSENRCPKLGFEDDPSTVHGRPTRLHRCFAAGAPLPLSLDQQRELCLSEKFGMCPRLAMAGLEPGLATGRDSVPRRVEARVEAEPEDPRIVRLPFPGRNKVKQRDARQGRQAVGGSAQPARLRPQGATGTATRDASTSSAGTLIGSAAHDRHSVAANTTPLRARMERSSASVSSPASPAYGAPGSTAVADRRNLIEPRTAAVGGTDSAAPRQRLVAQPVEQSPGRLAWFGIAAGGGAVLAVLAVVVFLLRPQLGALFVDDSVDTSALPNTRAIVAGTPFAQVTGAKVATPAARATAAAAAAANTASLSPDQARPAEPTLPVSTSVARVAPAALQGGTTIFEEDFSGSTPYNWPNNPRGNAWLTNKSYRLAPTQVGQFVAISAPIVETLQDVIVSASFHKVGGPSGGGYGIIVRDQGPARDGTGQDGHYYVLEVGDKGELGIWRRDGDHWADLLPWQKSDAVKPGMATNEVTVRAIGSRLSLSVNGTEVAVRNDATYTAGIPGLFAGGDGNQVSVDHFTVQVL
jgi:hypothetical protein